MKCLELLICELYLSLELNNITDSFLLYNSSNNTNNNNEKKKNNKKLYLNLNFRNNSS